MDKATGAPGPKYIHVHNLWGLWPFIVPWSYSKAPVHKYTHGHSQAGLWPWITPWSLTRACGPWYTHGLSPALSCAHTGAGGATKFRWAHSIPNNFRTSRSVYYGSLEGTCTKFILMKTVRTNIRGNGPLSVATDNCLFARTIYSFPWTIICSHGQNLS